MSEAKDPQEGRGFKGNVAGDLSRVFLNLEEFGERHFINGERVPCVVQSPTAQERFQQGLQYRGYDGYGGTLIIVHVARDSLPEPPADTLDLDGTLMEVDSVTDDMGMLSITLHHNASGANPYGI